MGADSFRIPGAAWKHHFDERLDGVRGPSKLMGIGSMIKMLPMFLRFAQHMRNSQNDGFDPVNVTTPESTGPYQGIPLGGIGAGAIGRGWRGDFRRWQLRTGVIQNKPVWADQFSLYVASEEGASKAGAAQVLFPGGPDNGALGAWRWGMPPVLGIYHALFPRAWTSYDEPLPGVRLTCRQLSPVIARNYRESCYPVAEFRWEIENISDHALTVGLMFTFQNGMGSPNDHAGGHCNEPFRLGNPAAAKTRGSSAEEVTGVLLHHAYRQSKIGSPHVDGKIPPSVFEDPLTFAIAARAVDAPPPGGERSARRAARARSHSGAMQEAAVTYRARFDTNSDGGEVWQDFAADGRLDNAADPRPTAPGETIGAALAVTVHIPAGERREVSFALAWDMPVIRPGAGTPYRRRYTRFYGADGLAAARIARDALLCADEWEKQITAWQTPILANEDLPAWYRQALFNELYYLVDGGTLWVDPLDGSPPDPEMGRFAYLESHEYRFLNTYDVHFYASFALAQLWPRLELALQRDLAAATLAEDTSRFVEAYSGKRVPRKQRGAVPHDIGLPAEDPWRRVNGYFMHDVNTWKDLNPKFVLQVYRDYVITRDKQFVRDTWEAVEAAIAYVQRYDRDGDGLIENDGFPDQTYDVWSVKGPSAYTGGLWLACLSAGVRLAEVAGRLDMAQEYAARFEKGRQSFEAKLWNGRYYNYDSSRSRQHDSIMADQLAGQWYARACGLPPIVEPLRARAALSTIYDWNVLRFNGARMGAVNGMRPNGQLDTTSIQSQEVWAGTTYALAASMIQEGMVETGFKTAFGAYHMTYEQTGYWFQTPEAWDSLGNYRAICYMRPLAIWAMQWALEKKGERV